MDLFKEKAKRMQKQERKNRQTEEKVWKNTINS